jgi:hypothetical protein
MTIFWVDLLPALRDLITELAVEANDPMWLEQGAQWSTIPQKNVAEDTAVQIDLAITSSGDGEYETRYVKYTDPGTGEISDRALFSGQREFVLNVQCSTHQTDFARWALVYAERIRSRLQATPRVEQLIDEMGVAFWRYGTIQNLQGVEDLQAVAIANLDLFGRVGFQDDPTAGVLVPLFLSIAVRSKLAGYTEGAPPNFEDTFTKPAAEEP